MLIRAQITILHEPGKYRKWKTNEKIVELFINHWKTYFFFVIIRKFIFTDRPTKPDVISDTRCADTAVKVAFRWSCQSSQYFNT